MIKCFMLDLEYAGFFSFDGVSLSTVGSVITRTAAGRYKRGSASLLHYVRDFLKYLYEYGLVETDLSVAVPKIAAPFRKIYQGFTGVEIRKLLAAVDCNTLVGKRDYAIMTIAAQTGLRTVDILKLKRGDIDWRKREIHISQSKTGEPLCLTLEIESGNAIYDYILNARQVCNIPNVFLSTLYPLRALRPSTAHSIIVKYMAIAGIEATARQRYGFHSFRRALGTRLLESGTPIHLLSQLLGHSDLNSAKPYMSASEQGLKECCLSLALNESEVDTQ
jgi:integrase